MRKNNALLTAAVGMITLLIQELPTSAAAKGWKGMRLCSLIMVLILTVRKITNSMS